jgi:hypothetical protein
MVRVMGGSLGKLRELRESARHGRPGSVLKQRGKPGVAWQNSTRAWQGTTNQRRSPRGCPCVPQNDAALKRLVRRVVATRTRRAVGPTSFWKVTGRRNRKPSGKTAPSRPPGAADPPHRTAPGPSAWTTAEPQRPPYGFPAKGTPASEQSRAQNAAPGASVAYRWFALIFSSGPPLSTGWLAGSCRSA